MIITISGLPGSGTTTIANLLSKALNLKLISTGEIFRELAIEKGISLEEFGELAETNSEIVEGRLTGFMFHKNNIQAFKIWIDAPLEIRAKRVADREGKTVKQTQNEIKIRERCERDRYKRIYGIDLREKSIYDLVINSKDKKPEKILDIILSEIK
jgi:cytidylate kinase